MTNEELLIEATVRYNRDSNPFDKGLKITLMHDLQNKELDPDGFEDLLRMAKEGCLVSADTYFVYALDYLHRCRLAARIRFLKDRSSGLNGPWEQDLI